MDKEKSIIELWIEYNKRYNSSFVLTRQQRSFAEKELQNLIESLPKDFPRYKIESTLSYAFSDKKWALKIQNARHFVDLWNVITYEMENGCYNPSDNFIDYKSVKEKAERAAVDAKWEAAKEATRLYGDMTRSVKYREQWRDNCEAEIEQD